MGTESMRGFDNRFSGRTVAVIGGGITGLSAAWRLASSGANVTLFERKKYLGGRLASVPIRFPRDAENRDSEWSVEDSDFFSGLDEFAGSFLIDNGQHLFLDACSELRGIQKEWGIDPYFDRFSPLPFLFEGWSPWRFASVPALPGRLAFLPALLSPRFLTLKDRISILTVANRLFRWSRGRNRKEREIVSFGDFLRRSGASDRSRKIFWEPVIRSALCGGPDEVAFDAGVKVMIEGLLGRGRPMESGPVLSIPNRPLRRIYHDALYPKFREKGIDVRLLTPIDRLEVGETSSDDGEGMVVALRTGSGERLSFDRYLLALEPEGMGSLLRRSGLLSLVDTLGVDRFRFGAITAIHLWFDGRLIDEPAAVLSAGTGDVDGMGDWLFVPRFQNYWRVDEEGNRNGEEWVYHQVLISGTGKSRSITGDGTESLKEREGRIIEAVWKNLRRLIPTARRLRLGGGIVTTVPSAVLLPTPDLFNHPPVLEGIDGIPRNLTILGNRFADGWPDTMEGAVRSTRGF